MANDSHVWRRSDRTVDRHYPALPTLPETIPCDGLAFVLREGAAMPVLRPLRDRIQEIRRGPIEAGTERRDLVLVTFVRPTHVDGASWPTGLPLVATDAAVLRSFGQDLDRHADVPSPAARSFRRVELWWNGRLHRIGLETLAPVPIAILWDMPRVVLHRPTPRAKTATEGRASRSAVPLLKQPRDHAQVSHARIPFGEGGADMLADMAANLLDLDERTKLSSIFRQIRRRIGGGESGGTRPGEPGILENLAGWLRWHTPLGASLKRQFGERLSLVEKLIASGDLDGALKLALRLGGGKSLDTPKNHYPNQLPSARATLDFDLSRFGFAAPILGDGLFQSMHQRYLRLAEQLERDGDFRRAAYIHSQLLDNNQRAAQTLERGELYAEAAKLALGAKLEPALTIRLLYKAGELDAALALAKRAACFDQLAEDSRGKHGAYHAYVIKAWTDVLIATGQPLRALQVTDALAQAGDAGEAIQAARHRWLVAALGDTDSDDWGSELMARALLTAPWDNGDCMPRGIENFPFVSVQPASSPFAAVLARLQMLVLGEAQGAGEALVELMGGLLRIAAPSQREQAAFWKGPAQLLLETAARAMVEFASNRLRPDDLQALQALLRTAQLPVMAADVQKLRKLHSAGPAPSPEWRVPAAAAVRPAIRCACLLGNGQMLAWRESQVLELLDRHGAPIWRQTVSEVTALVAVGTSPNAILVQQQPDGSRQLTRFASHRRTFHPIGAINLVAHHDITSESQWLVQIGGNIGALDLVKLCAPAPAVEFLWSCALTDRLRALAFAHQPAGPSWITQDISSDRWGIIEIWTLRPSGELVTSICLPKLLSAGEQPPEPGSWFWNAKIGPGSIGSMREAERWMNVTPWSEPGEGRARNLAARRLAAGMEGVDSFQSCDFGRPFVRLEDVTDASGSQERATVIVETTASSSAMTLRHDAGTALTCVARSAPDASGRHWKGEKPAAPVLLADNFGRLFIVDARARRVTPL